MSSVWQLIEIKSHETEGAVFAKRTTSYLECYFVILYETTMVSENRKSFSLAAQCIDLLVS